MKRLFVALTFGQGNTFNRLGGSWKTPWVAIVLSAMIALATMMGSCGKNPSDPGRGNPLDEDNSETAGDPFHLSATVWESAVSLEWDAVEVLGASGYRVYRREGLNGSLGQVHALPSTQWTDSGVSDGQTYSYKIGLVGQGGEISDWTNQVAVTVHTLAEFSIADGAQYTVSRTVDLYVKAADADSLWVWNGVASDSTGGQWRTKNAGDGLIAGWILVAGEGEKQVNAWIQYETGQARRVTDTIALDQTPPEVSNILPRPLEGAVEVVIPVGLSWTAANDALSGVSTYRVLLDEGAVPSTERWSGPETSCEILGLGPLTDYQWSVVAVDGAGNEATAGPWTFTTMSFPQGFVLVPAGSFTMGDGVAYCGTNEYPVELTEDFYLGQTEVTNQQYIDMLNWAWSQNPKLITATSATVTDAMGSTQELVDLDDSDCEIEFTGSGFILVADSPPLRVDLGNHPVKEVTWYGAASYCDWLSLQEELVQAYDHGTWACNGGDPYRAQGYRLPTDAEWEYAAQYDDERIYPWGNESPSSSRANYNYNSGWTTEVGSYPAEKTIDGKALYDMAGNVWEWCNDWHQCAANPDSQDPPGPSSGSRRVLRGGSWYLNTDVLRCANRNNYNPASSNGGFGFRVARTVNP